MSLKSIIGKIFNTKTPPRETEPTQQIQHEVSFSTTMIEPKPDLLGGRECGIEIFIKNEKTEFHKISGETSIGRDPAQSDIAIPELIVSKLHCTIYFKDDEVYIRDDRSTNGTFVNGQPMEQQKLDDNDMITLGRKGTVRIIFYKKGEK